MEKKINGTISGLQKYFVASLIILLVSLSLVFEYYQIVSEQTATQQSGEQAAKQVATQTADCGVVLTGSRGRIREAFEALGQKKIKKLIIAGVYKDAQLLQIFPHLPFYTEISEEDVILEKKSESTYGNAIQSLALVNALKCRDILLITSQLHMYRAHRIFKVVYPSTIEIKKMTVPNKKDFHIFDYLMETIKSSFYWALGLVN